MNRLLRPRPRPEKQLLELAKAFLYLAAVSLIGSLLVLLGMRLGGSLQVVLGLPGAFGPFIVVLTWFDSFFWLDRELLRWVLLLLYMFSSFVMVALFAGTGAMMLGLE